MKILLYSEGKNLFNKSGVGKALNHQIEALEKNNVDFTLNPNDDFDILHVNTIGLLSHKIVNKAKKNNIPVVCTTHTTYEDFRNSVKFSNQLAFIIRILAKSIYNKADYLISPSLYTKNLIKDKYLYDKNKDIRVISNGVKLNEFKQNVDLIDKFKKEYNITRPTIISVGLPFIRKGIVDVAYIAKQLPDYNFIWFGASNFKNILPKKARDIINNPPKNLIFPGYVDQDVLLGAYSGANLFLFPTYEENEGIVILESLAMKLPVLVRDIPVYDNWLENNVNCYKASNNEEFISKINEIVSNDNSKVTENGYNIAKSKEISEIGKQLKEYYEYILQKKNS